MDAALTLSETERWAVGVVVTLAVCIAIHRLTLSRERRSRIISAGAQFRTAFATELSALRELRITETGQVFEILSAAYPKHEAAYTEYLQHLSALRRWRLRRNWMAYRGEYPKPPELASEDQRYRLGHWIGSDIDAEEAKRKCAMRVIGGLSPNYRFHRGE